MRRFTVHASALLRAFASVRRISARTRLRYAYGTFAAVAIAVGAMTYLGQPRSHFLSTFGPNLAPDAFGVLVALLLIEPIVRLQRRRELEPLRRRAIGGILEPTGHLIRLLGEMYKAVADSPGPVGTAEEVPFTAVEDLVDAWRASVTRLNVLSPAPRSKEITWAQYLQQETYRIVMAVQPILDRYVEAIGIETLTKIEDLIGHTQFRYGFLEPPVRTVSQDGITRSVFLFASPDERSQLLLDQFALRLKVFFDAFTDYLTEPLEVPSIIWTHMPPRWGSARFEGEIRPDMCMVLLTELPPNIPGDPPPVETGQLVLLVPPLARHQAPL